MLSDALTNLATKDDIARLEREMAAVKVELTAELRTEVAALQTAMSANRNELLMVLLAVAALLFAALRMT